MTLPSSFLNTLVAELDNTQIAGIILGGSYARGDATLYSDVDIACFVHGEENSRPKRFLYRDSLLVSIPTKSIEGVRREMGLPNRAIWTVPGLSGCRILLDKDGSVAELLRDIEAFRWEPLQEAANEYTSLNMAMSAEQVHKVMSELARGDGLALAYATSKLFSWLTETIAVQRGVMVQSDRTYYRQVQEAAGAESEWARLHNVVAGVELGQLVKNPARERAMAVLDLYRETLALVRSVMRPDHLAVAQQASRVADLAPGG